MVRAIAEQRSVTHRGTPPPGLIVGEFRDGQGRPHVMLANASAEKHACVEVRVNGRAVYGIVGGNDEQPIGRMFPDGAAGFDETVMPGQALFFRVD